MTTTNKYNGWTNYATWRVHLEIFDGTEHVNYMTAGWLEDYAKAVVLIGTEENSLAYDYAMCFLDEVNWNEIAEALSDNE